MLFLLVRGSRYYQLGFFDISIIYLVSSSMRVFGQSSENIDCCWFY